MRMEIQLNERDIREAVITWLEHEKGLDVKRDSLYFSYHLSTVSAKAEMNDGEDEEDDDEFEYRSPIRKKFEKKFVSDSVLHSDADFLNKFKIE